MSARVLTALRGALPSLRNPSVLGPGRGRRRPRTSVRSGPSVPAVVLRCALVLLCLAAGTALATSPAHWWLALVVGAVLAVRPHAALLTLGVAALVGMYAVVGSPGWQLPVLVLVTHAVLRLGAVADAVGWDGHVELAVLRDALVPFLAVQAVAQTAGALALVLDGAAPVPWLGVAATAALGALGWALVRGLRAGTRP